MDTGSYIFNTLFAVFLDDRLEPLWHYLGITLPFWLPILLAFALWSTWIQYVRAKKIYTTKKVLLELKLPPEVSKSPLAMELVLSGLHQTGSEGTWYKRYILGQARPWYSLEIASFEGAVHFYIWTQEGYKDLVESQFYGQYPNIEIEEVQDYTDLMPYYDKDRFGLWGCYFRLTKEDPYPIKTYVDYGLDRDPKEEFKNDPLTPMIEYMSSLRAGEYMWIQILFRAHREKARGFFGKTTWQDEGREIIAKIIERMRPESTGDRVVLPRSPTKAESTILEALERSISKLGFDVGIRAMYFAKPSNYSGTRIPGMLGMFKFFGAPSFESADNKIFGFNSFAPKNVTDFENPWEDFNKYREMYRRHHIVDGYRRRSYFFSPYIKDPFVLNAEELATIFHPIGTVLQTPSVERVPSRKGAAPPNLPR